MAEAFVGTWNLISSEKFDDYMKELGECAVCRVRLREHVNMRVKGRWMLTLLFAAPCEIGAKWSFKLRLKQWIRVTWCERECMGEGRDGKEGLKGKSG